MYALDVVCQAEGERLNWLFVHISDKQAVVLIATRIATLMITYFEEGMDAPR